MKFKEFLAQLIEGQGISQSEIARKSGVRQPTINRIYRGDSEPSMESIAKVCRVYNRNPGSFIEWEGENLSSKPVLSLVSSSTRMIPVVSGINGGSASMLCWEDAYPKGHGMDMVVCPDYLERDDKAYALRVHGESMAPKYTEGMLVYVSPSAEIRNGDFVVAKLRDGKTLLKKVQFADNLVILQSINLIAEPEPVITSRQDLEFLSKVVGSKER